jgi:hypothetical protein
MKLPLEALYHAVSVYDRVLLKGSKNKMEEKPIKNDIVI